MKTRDDFPYPTECRSSAILAVLFSLVLITLLIAAFSARMRTERMASSAYSKQYQAELMAQNGLQHAIALLAENIPPAVPNSSLTPTNWFVHPGELTLQTGNNKRSIPLHSGVSTSSDDPNLNRRLFDGSSYNISDSGNEMRVRWIDVPEDPSQPPNPSTNPIIGRYAFWVEPENSRLDITLAQGRNQAVDAAPTGSATTYTTPYFQVDGYPGTVADENADSPGRRTLGHPQGLSLAVLDSAATLSAGKQQLLDQKIEEFNARADKDWEGLGGILSSVEEIQQYSSSPDSFFHRNKFDLTILSLTPEFNAFGYPRLYAMRSFNRNVEDGAYQFEVNPTYAWYWDERVPLWWETVNDRQDYRRTYAALSKLAETINRTDWPGYSGQSFATKWGNGNTAMGRREIDQFVLNLYALSNAGHDWGEDRFGGGKSGTASMGWLFTPQLSGQQLPGSPPPIGTALWTGPLSGERMLPQGRIMMINEMGITVRAEQKAGDPSKYYVAFDLNLEFYLPEGYAGAPIDFEQPGRFKFVGCVSSLAYTITVNGSSTRKQARLFRRGWVTPPTFGDLGPDDPYRNLALQVVAPPGTQLSPGNYLRLDSNATDAQYLDANPGGVPIEYNSGTTVVITDVEFKVVLANERRDPAANHFPFVQHCPIRHGSTDTIVTDADGNTFTVTQGGTVDEPSTITIQEFTPSGNIPATFSLTLGPLLPSVTKTMEIEDPRLNHLAEAWNPPLGLTPHTLGSRNSSLSAFPDSSPDGDESKLAYVPTPGGGGWSARQNDHRMISPGWYSLAHTGMQTGTPWRTLDLRPGGGGNPPDYLLLDLLASATPYHARNASRGKVNLNSVISPQSSEFSPPTRTKALEAVFDQLQVAGSSIDEAAVVTAIRNEDAARNGYAYVGEVSEGLPSFGSNQWQQEALVRNLVGQLDVRANTFGVWGIGQAVKQLPDGSLKVLGEQRFHATVLREIWPGIDGQHGYAKADSIGSGFDGAGTYASLPTATPGNYLDNLDGPVALAPAAYRVDATGAAPAPSYMSTPLQNSRNPARPYFRYRPYNFKFLNE